MVIFHSFLLIFPNWNASSAVPPCAASPPPAAAAPPNPSPRPRPGPGQAVVGKTWETVGKPWENQGKTWGKIRRTKGKPWKPWQKTRENMAKPWDKSRWHSWDFMAFHHEIGELHREKIPCGRLLANGDLIDTLFKQLGLTRVCSTPKNLDVTTRNPDENQSKLGFKQLNLNKLDLRKKWVELINTNG